MRDNAQTMEHECSYKPRYFLRMLNEHGAIDTACRLLQSESPSDGFITLCENNRLDLSVEALILQDTWNQLFNEEDLVIARNRLRDYGYII